MSLPLILLAGLSSLATAAPTTNGVDLAIDGVYLQQDATQTWLRAQVSNEGDTPSGAFWVDLFQNPSGLPKAGTKSAGAEWVEGLAAGESRTVEFALTDLSHQTTYMVIADLDEETKDVDPNSNVQEVMLSHAPDLVVRHIQLRGGDKGTVKALATVSNHGNRAISNFVVVFQADGVDVSKEIVARLEPGASVELEFLPPSGSSIFSATVDPEDKLQEHQENNNHHTIDIGSCLDAHAPMVCALAAEVAQRVDDVGTAFDAPLTDKVVGEIRDATVVSLEEAAEVLYQLPDDSRWASVRDAVDPDLVALLEYEDTEGLLEISFENALDFTLLDAVGIAATERDWNHDGLVDHLDRAEALRSRFGSYTGQDASGPDLGKGDDMSSSGPDASDYFWTPKVMGLITGDGKTDTPASAATAAARAVLLSFPMAVAAVADNAGVEIAGYAAAVHKLVTGQTSTSSTSSGKSAWQVITEMVTSAFNSGDSSNEGSAENTTAESGEQANGDGSSTTTTTADPACTEGGNTDQCSEEDASADSGGGCDGRGDDTGCYETTPTEAEKSTLAALLRSSVGNDPDAPFVNPAVRPGMNEFARGSQISAMALADTIWSRMGVVVDWGEEGRPEQGAFVGTLDEDHLDPSVDYCEQCE